MKYYVIDKDGKEDVPITHNGRNIDIQGWRLYHYSLPECWDDTYDKTDLVLVFDTNIQEIDGQILEIKTLRVAESIANIKQICTPSCDGYIKLTVDQARQLSELFIEEMI